MPSISSASSNSVPLFSDIQTTGLTRANSELPEVEPPSTMSLQPIITLGIPLLLSVLYYCSQLYSTLNIPLWVPIVLAIPLISVASYTVDACRTRFSYAGRHVFITGGSDGLGWEIAQMLAEGKFGTPSVITLFARNLEKLHERTKDLRVILLKKQHENGEKGAKCKVVFVSGDASKQEDLNSAVKQAETEGGCGVNVMIAAAGFSDPQYFEDLGPEDFDRAMRVR